MVKIENTNHIFQHPWEAIAVASWFKYPNPARPDVEQIDFIRRHFDPETGILYTTRLTTMKLAIPSILQWVFGCNPRVYFLEDAMIDPKNDKMVLRARNLSFNNLVLMEEMCTYTRNKENRLWTSLAQQAKVSAFPYGVSKKIEEFSVQTFRQNAAKGREFMEQAITKLQKEAEEKLNAVEEIISNDFEKLGNIIKQEAQETVDSVVDALKDSQPILINKV
mmetsp:Transcript_22164/g.30916  ORF Transcript_22164/g.30916 Transcript_22164/m.30916 type:complete len:221 (-) Transcript_22164:1075-1737(-)|eukprot:CAMPEP_0168550948 /NCGR_PEP_ID=MMETSP0413-20121227/5910_1 /TAXON_ID=136452 /ORGANISM="Filamoeba nolandi, Strain NC-AS-23-1" /LENGTH=220 /DNA_ID=CAMNT_0008581439 /DNA_START=105 /DNA_END=767 /DNA_ORIENTATION=+